MFLVGDEVVFRGSVGVEFGKVTKITTAGVEVRWPSCSFSMLYSPHDLDFAPGGARASYEDSLPQTLEAAQKQVGGTHYQGKAFQPWDIIDEWNLDFYLGNVMKYILRHPYKGGLEDLKKALHNLERKIELMERDENGVHPSNADAL